VVLGGALGFGLWALVFRRWVLVLGLWVLGFGFWVLGFGRWVCLAIGGFEGFVIGMDFLLLGDFFFLGILNLGGKFVGFFLINELV